MNPRYSIAQARDALAQLVHDAEGGRTIELTRRGQPVAVLVAFDVWQRLQQRRPAFLDALSAFRTKAGLHPLADDDLADLRDRGTGRPPPLDE